MIAAFLIVELDDAGRIQRIESFDEADLTDALVTLDEWYIAGEGADDEYLIRRLGDLVHAANSGTAASYRAMFREDCTVVNHRRLSFPMASIDDVVETERATHDVGATRTTLLPGIECRGDAALLRQDERLVTSEGNEYATDMFLVVHQTAGRFDVIESHDPECVDAARARFAELAVERPTPVVDNHAVRINERFGWLAAHRGVDEARALLAPDLLAFDRRPGVAAPDMVGPDARLANLAAVADVFDRIDHTNVAVRGRRLMLLQWTISSADGFAASGYDVTEVDETSRICRIVTFDQSQLVAAISEMDDRYAEIRTEPESPFERWFRDGLLADFDWAGDGYSNATSPEAIMTDHRLLGFPDAGRDEYRARALAMIETVPDAVQLTNQRYVKGPAELMVTDITGTSTDGMPVEWHFVSVMRARSDGRLDRGAYFPVDRWADAVAQFEEWAAVAPEAPDPDIDTLAVRGFRRLAETASTDVEAALGLLTDDASGEAHESGPTRGAWVRGRDQWRGVLRSLGETYDQFSFEPVDVRGDRVVLLRYRFTEEDDVTSGLMVVAADAAGLIRRLDTFDEDDLSIALAALSEIHDALPSAILSERVSALIVENAVTRRLREGAALLAAGDRTFAALFGEDVVAEDRRALVSMPIARGREAFVASVLGSASVYDSLDLVPLAVRGDHLALVRQRFSSEGFETIGLVLWECDEEMLVRRAVTFDESDLVPALAELDARHAVLDVRTPVERRVLEGFAVLNHRDWDALEAVMAEDLAVRDHRRIGFPPGDGRGALTAALRGLVEQVPDVAAVVAATETNGRVALVRTHQLGIAVAGTVAAWDWLLVIALDAEDTIGRMEYFELDDEPAARGRFEELADGAASADPPSSVTELLEPTALAFASRDWEFVRRHLADDVELVDRRSTVRSDLTFGRDGVIELFRGFRRRGVRVARPVARRLPGGASRTRAPDVPQQPW